MAHEGECAGERFGLRYLLIRAFRTINFDFKYPLNVLGQPK